MTDPVDRPDDRPASTSQEEDGRVLHILPVLLLPILLLASVALVVAGVGTWSVGAALVVAGLLLAGWAWLFFGDIPDQPKGAVPESGT